MTTEQITPELIHCDQQTLDRQINAVNKGLPQAKIVFDAYNAIPGIEPLNAADWLDIAFDTPSFLQKVTEAFYQKNYASAHEALGINQQTGMNLVNDKLPKFDSFLSTLQEYRDLCNRNHTEFGPYNAYTVEDGQLVINQQFVDDCTNSAKLIFSTQTEMNVKAAVEKLCEALVEINEVTPPGVFRLHNYGYGEIHLTDLSNLVDIRVDNFERKFTAKPKLDFYKNLHGFVVREKMQ